MSVDVDRIGYLCLYKDMIGMVSSPEYQPQHPLTEAGLPQRTPIVPEGPPESLSMEQLATMGRRGESNDPATTDEGTTFRATVSALSPAELDRFIAHPELYPQILAQRNAAFVTEPRTAHWLFARQRTIPRQPQDHPKDGIGELLTVGKRLRNDPAPAIGRAAIVDNLIEPPRLHNKQPANRTDSTGPGRKPTSHRQPVRGGLRSPGLRTGSGGRHRA